MKIYNYLLALVFSIAIIIPASTNISGQAEYFYMVTLKDIKLVNIPFRLLNLDVQHQVSDNFNVFGNLGVEYRNRRDTDFMTDSNLEDFLLDIRELYMSYYFNNSEIRIGKQVHSWGSVDENSPIDNLNGYDYYYLLLGGSEKKLGAYSLAYDVETDYFYDLLGATHKISFVYSPMHNTNRIPVNDPDYPIGLPSGSSPTEETTILNDNNPAEYGLNIKSSFNFGDISLSYLGLYDRLFNLSGLTIYTDEAFTGGVVEPVPRYSYRYTDVYALGAMLLFDDFTFSFDYALFESNDTNDLDTFNNLEENPYYISSPEDDVFGAPALWIEQTRAFEEKVKYSQLAVQFEMPFENNLRVNSQYFKHEIIEYSSNPLGLSCLTLAGYDSDGDGSSTTPNWHPNWDGGDIPGPLPLFTPADCEDLESGLGMTLDDFEPQNLFIPGVGTPYAMITSEGMLINIEKAFPDKSLTVDINGFFDAANGDGRLISLETEYELESGVELGFGITKIYGDDTMENYNFNNMESFSSFRSRLTYYF